MTTMAASSSPSAAGAPKRERLFNFSAGPGCLPDEVLKQIQQDVWNIGGSGIGILEHSHRGKVVDKIWEEAEALVRDIGNIGPNYKVLWLTGGATTQNFMVPMNLLPKGGTADYIVTGYWGQKSYEECKKFGTAHLAATSEDRNHSYIPAQTATKYSPAPAYVHYTSNNTIYGTEWHRVPEVPAGVPLVCDMSSDMFAGPMDLSKFGLIYAGAQKNLGPAGTTLVIVRDDLLERCPKEVATMLQYRVHAKDGSRHNTPPVFSVYAVGLVLKWIKKNGGVSAMAKRNQDKARPIYDVLDGSKFYKGHADKDARSLMNLTFKLPTPELDDKFIKEAGALGMDGIKGHRATGGIRASMYNAFPPEGGVAFAQFMKDFERKNG
jgi:phosphoserine aminotransferase